MTPQRRKILIVDDNERDLDLLEEVLGDRFELRRECSGEAALQALATFPADLVLLDIAMPGIDGYETCHRIATDLHTRGTKVLLVAGRNQTEDRIRGYQCGASDYVFKPLDPEELSAKIDVFLALKTAEDESRAKSEFLANISHEIRTPMTAILGYSENLRDSSLPESARQHAIDTIWRNGQHLLELINNVLDISKIEASRLQLERVACSPADIIADVANLMRARAESAGLTLDVECDGSIPARIQSDRMRIKQILINLVGNAIKFTRQGGIRIVTGLRAAAGPTRLLEVQVIDTGVGIASEKLGLLCEPFVQEDASITRRFGGTGLGLSISKRLAKLLGGDLEIHSELGKGSTFTVTVDAGDLEGVEMIDEIDDPAAVRTGASFGAAATLEIPCRILLVEDGPDNQRLLSYCLEKAGADVAIAENGQIGVDAAIAAMQSDRPFDVILMDMQMPVLDGYAATAKLREVGYEGPIVAITAHAMVGDQERCFAAGCDRFAAKPVNRESLVRMIHELVEDHR